MQNTVSRLKVARVAAGLSQFELAERVGVSEVTISRIETGRLEAPRILKARIAEVLGMPDFELFGRYTLNGGVR
jgi:transcriptional regulator with XRE-family HTH domain